MSSTSSQRTFSVADVRRLYDKSEKLVMSTCYDASFAALCAGAGIEMLLVGDSLGMVVQGHATTLAVSLEQMAYHVECVARARTSAMIIADMPFGTYQASVEAAFANAARMLAAGAHMVKIEGGEAMAATVRFLVERGIPVCGHVGLTPQSVHALGGFRMQGRSEEAGKEIEAAALALQDAGAAMIVLEAMPARLAARITQALRIPTIGIGAGPECSGQVLVLYDMLGIYPGPKPRFVRNFMHGAPTIANALQAYVRAVKDGSFPAPEHSFT